jgi:hypothetical protein
MVVLFIRIVSKRKAKELGRYFFMPEKGSG